MVFLKPSQPISWWWLSISDPISNLSSASIICSTSHCPLPSPCLTLNVLFLWLIPCFLSLSLPLQLFLILSSAAALNLKEKTAIIEELGFHIVSSQKPINSLFPQTACACTRARTHTLHTTHSASVHMSLCPGKKLSPDLHGILNGSVLS